MNNFSKIVFSDDNTIVYFNIKGGKTIDLLDIDDTDEVVNKSENLECNHHLPSTRELYAP